MSILNHWSPLRRIGACVAAIAATVLLLPPSAASAAVSSYQRGVANYAFEASGYAGGYVSCPTGTKAIASGAATTGRMLAGLTTFDGNGAYHTAANTGTNGSLQVSAQCVEPSRLAGSTLTTTTIRDSREGWRTYDRKVVCPSGTLPYGGGGFLTTSTGPSPGGLNTFASTPEGNGWRYSAAGYRDGGNLVVSTHCLPRAKLGRIISVTETDTATGNRYNLFASARCPSGYFAYAGGAWSHAIGSTTPTFLGHLRISQMAADDRGWTATGTVYGQLTSKVLCTDRLG